MYPRMDCFKKIIIIIIITTFTFPQKIYIHAGRLIDGITEIPVEMVTIIINGNYYRKCYAKKCLLCKRL